MTSTRPCPYCTEEIPTAALRCSHCAGQLRFCKSCNSNQGTTQRKKTMTLVYRKTLFFCMQCGRKLGESRVDA